MLMYWPGHCSHEDVPEATPTFFLDSNTTKRKDIPTDRPIVFVFNPDKNGIRTNGWKWWHTEFKKLPRYQVAMVLVDMEWDEHFQANDLFGVPADLIRQIDFDFKSCRALLELIFPGVRVSFYGDMAPVENISWTGQKTGGSGEHLFWAWQHLQQGRISRAMYGDLASYINMFWYYPHLSSISKDYCPMDVVWQWINKARVWVDLGGNPKKWEQKDHPLVIPGMLKNWAEWYSRTERHVALYYCHPSPALEEFREGWRLGQQQSTMWSPGPEEVSPVRV